MHVFTSPSPEINIRTHAYTSVSYTAGTMSSMSLHGGRIFIPAGEKLCAEGVGAQLLAWSGFRPYE
jgi:hypothetical protein